ncbi:MAG: site-2 protease family protein [Candidatus Electrothrix sp. YB6]
MDPNQLIQKFLILAPPFLFALTFHELAHGYTAWKLGDPTAKEQGRLTMNPLRHLDPLGVIAFVLMNIGWAKPVPVNAGYFRNPQKGMLLTALAGPAANILLAVLSALVVKLLIVILAPVLPAPIFDPLLAMTAASVWINVMLAVFNCLPIPPLDGSKILMGLLPPKTAVEYAKMEPYGFILLLVLFYLGIIGKVLMPIISFANNLLLS